MTSNPIKSFALGTLITAIIQSSSAVTVILVGLVNSGIMNLSQTVSVIIGANVGTTITAWILSLTAIQESAGRIFQLLKPESFSPVLAFIGVIMMMSFNAYINDDLKLAKKIEPLEAVIKKGVRRAKNNHILRLKKGSCSAETSFLFSDLLNELRRIAAHCSNIAISIVQLYDTKFNKHKYSQRNKEEDLEFNLKYRDYKSKYRVKKNQELIN